MNQNEIIRAKLLSLSEPEYQKFSSRLLPGVDNILGVRLPSLRQIAKELAKGDWQEYLNNARCDSFEEIMLQGMTLGYVKAELPLLLHYVTNFLPKINNWSVCDSFCSGLKLPKLYKEKMWAFILPHLNSSHAYTVRFGIVMLLNYYIDETYIDQVLSYLDQIKYDSYYVKMAVAWAISICFIKFPDKTIEYLNNNSLDDITYQKTLNKIIESQKIDSHTKSIIRKMRK